MITSLRNGSALVFAYKLENKLEQQLAQLATLSQELEMATSTFPSMKILNTHQKVAALLRCIGLVGKPLHNW
jgi:hypothetical protein